MISHKIINGKIIRDSLLSDLKNYFSKFEKKNNKKAILAVFMVGDDPATISFVEAKKKVAQRIGVDFKLLKFNSDVKEDDLILKIREENKKSDGIIVQLPLPDNFNKDRVLNTVLPEKDIDLLSEKAFLNFKNKIILDFEKEMLPPVAGAVYEILKAQWLEKAENWNNKNILIVGRGKLVGEPVSILLEKIGLNFDVVDIKTEKSIFNKKVSEADLIISGAGVPNLINNKMIKDGVFLIDAGTSESNKKLIGDIDLNCIEKASYFSKTPGGVGPVTVAVLFKNLMIATKGF